MHDIREFYTNGIRYEKRANSEHGSILSYHLRYLLSIGWMIPRRGSIFSIYEIVGILFIVVSITSLLAYSSCEMPGATSSCLTLPIPSTSTLTLMTLCSFILAFFVNTAITRWWAVRSALQSLMGAAQELLLCVAGGLEAGLETEPDSRMTVEEKFAIIDKANNMANKISAYSLLILMMLFNNARDQRPIKELVELDMLTSDELKELLSLNHGKAAPLHICNLLIQTIERGAKQGLLGVCPQMKQSNLLIALEAIRSIRSNASAVTMYSDVQLPYPLIQIVAAVVYTFTIQLIIVSASFIAAGAAEHNGDTTTGYMTLIMYTFVLLGLLRLFEVLENPLGDDAADFPGDTYYRNLKHNLTSAREDMVRIQRQGVSLTGLTRSKSGGRGEDSAYGTSFTGQSTGSDSTNNPMHVEFMSLVKTIPASI